tara:strand:- start:5077 stop:5640 length:564 start_codon:yes stop_codon:yes gene_type:complete
MPTSPSEMMNTMLVNLEEKTGNTLSHWISVIEKSGEEKHMAIIKHLKTNHGFTHGYANLIAFKFRERFDAPKSGDEMVDDLFSGAKANLKPIYDKLVKLVQSFGKDVEISPRKTYITIRRSKQFAIFKPSTTDRLDVGLVLKGVEFTDRLTSDKKFSGMMTHCIAVHSEKDIDPELENYLSQGYNQA